MIHILNYGMGVESTAILLRWLLDKSSRDFDVSDLLVPLSVLMLLTACVVYGACIVRLKNLEI